MSSLDKRVSIAIQQTIIPDYRMGLFRLLREHWGDQFQIYAGEADFGRSPVSTSDAWKCFQRINNVYLFGHRFLWQVGSLRALLSADVTVLNANMRVLSGVFVQGIRKLIGRPTVLWGHVQGQNAFASILRGLYLRSCDGFIAYTESQAELLRERYPWLKVWVAANSCVSSSDCVPVIAESRELNSFLYVGRLVEAKKVRLLLDGFIQAREQSLISDSIRLVFVGDGAERPVLEARANEAGVSDVVDFKGHVSAVETLRSYYRTAICSVSSGYVGLSATQSFSFGVPMLIADDEFHSPEIEACKEGFNAMFFSSNNANSLAHKLGQMLNFKSEYLVRREVVAAWTQSNYSFEVMRDVFVDAVDGVLGK